MPLTLLTATSEKIVGPEVERRIREAMEATGRAVLLVPSFPQALDAQRELAVMGGLALGVTVTTVEAWAEERWEVWGDGSRLVDDASRDVLASRVLARAAWRPGSALVDTPGAAALLADLAREGLPWLASAPAPEGVTGAEAALVGLLAGYEAELRSRGLVEPCSAMAGLAEALDAGGALVPPVVLAGFEDMGRPQRELVCGLASKHDVTLVAREGEGPSSAQGRRLVRQVCDLAAQRGVEVSASSPEVPVGPGPARSPELQALLSSLFLSPAPAVSPTGALRVLLPAGPSAEPELVAREVASLARDGMRDVVVVAPDPVGAWSALAGRLVARGVSVRAQLSVPVASLELGRAYLEYVRAVARLVELDGAWPPAEVVPDAPRSGTVRVRLADMSWWPPRDLSDFLISGASHMDSSRARRLDAEWRANRLLTPAAVLTQLQSERDVSPEVASATRELLRGRLGSAASKLFSPYVQGEKTSAPVAHEAAAVLSAILGVAKSLKELGLSADPAEPGHVGLPELVELAVDVISRARASLRPERVVAGATCQARLMSPRAAARLAPLSADALLLLGQTSTESPVSAPDDVLHALLDAYGVEPGSGAMDEARARLAAVVRVPREGLVLERTLFGADGKERYPSVMMTELLACYGLAADSSAEEIDDALGSGRVGSRSEALVCENVSSTGEAAPRQGSETPSPAGRIDPSERECVSPPPEGVAAEDARPLLSASQIETYLECPYKWFSLRRLRLRDADAGFTGAEMGTFAHRVLEVTRRELLARAQERALDGHELADLRAAHEGAMQLASYREAVGRLEARAQEDPAARLMGSSVADPAALEEARAVLGEEFDAHLSHQYQLERGRRPLPQALVPHDARQAGQLRALRRDLSTLLDYEAGALVGFEPRYFEWGFGRGGAEVEYAGVRLTGTIDRIDVDAHGQAVVIDYKHKSDVGFAGEYDVFPKDGADPSALQLPRRVQSLVYGQVVRRAFPGLRVRAAVYLCTKGAHALAGAVDENVLDNVFGSCAPSSRRLPRIAVPRDAAFGREGQCGMEALLDACEELVAGRIERMLAGDIEAAPVDADACLFCPVLNCERRLRK
ncbi:MAG TPA: PD-(D/E)XK nuclease family protein [Candidatus Olsenella avicola]|nr:PD-(D/E)XK nuclease family protein [Candidatus Olsenella avicola]